MTYIITILELEDLDEPALRSKFCQILNDLARQEKAAQDCPLARISLDNIQEVMRRRRRRMKEPKM